MNDPIMVEKELEDYLKAVKKGPRYRGKAALINHLQGKSLTKRQAIEAACYDCMAFYHDGPTDCELPKCPLYPYMPFRK